jgi:hypothetical protein
MDGRREKRRNERVSESEVGGPTDSQDRFRRGLPSQLGLCTQRSRGKERRKREEEGRRKREEEGRGRKKEEGGRRKGKEKKKEKEEGMRSEKGGLVCARSFCRITFTAWALYIDLKVRKRRSGEGEEEQRNGWEKRKGQNERK